MEDLKNQKQRRREEVWRRLTEAGVARFPGAFGRIPNFVGAEEAAQRALDLPEVKGARVVFVNPDSPQYPLRAKLLEAGKILVVAAPRLKGPKPFLLLDPSDLKPHPLRLATLKGAFHYGVPLSLEELPEIDLFVTGCVAVTLNGVRLGKGGGFADREYSLLREGGKLRPEAPVLTTVHPYQIVNDLPKEPHDLRVDIIVTPRKSNLCFT